VVVYRPTRIKGKLPKLQSSWEGPYKIVTQHTIQRNPRLRLMVVHLDPLTPYQGATWDERP
jgi:hypothetical protein